MIAQWHQYLCHGQMVTMVWSLHEVDAEKEDLKVQRSSIEGCVIHSRLDE